MLDAEVGLTSGVETVPEVEAAATCPDPVTYAQHLQNMIGAETARNVLGLITAQCQ